MRPPPEPRLVNLLIPDSTAEMKQSKFNQRSEGRSLNMRFIHAAMAAIALSFALGSPGKVQAAALDTTAPQLTMFQAPASLDVTLGTNPLAVQFKATDDLSGVETVQAFAVGPNLQNISVSFSTSLQRTELTGTMLSFSVPAMSEPGVYTFYMAVVYDMAGNFTKYEEADLAALGRTSFLVKNKKGYDNVAPSIRGGNVLTPQISLSSRHPGTNREPTAGMSIDTYDTGVSVVAGMRDVMATFCLLNGSKCIYLSAFGGSKPRVGAATFYLGGQVYSDRLPGDYYLRNLDMWDYADNYARLTSTQFGGTTDFNQYFPTTSITLVP